jgi:hypothetical protein
MSLDSASDLADLADKLDDDDVSTLPASVLKKMVRALKAKRLAEREADESGEKKAEEEREKLASLHEEQKGKSPKVPVRKDDLPEELAEDEDESGGDEKPKKKG